MRGSAKLTPLAKAAILSRCVAAACVVFAVAVTSRAQPLQLPEPPIPIDPRPLNELISPAEKTSLAEARDPKKLVDAYCRISDAHLQAAFNAVKMNNSQTAERELDIYNKAVAGAGKEAFQRQDGRRFLSKKIEQTLYRQIKTLETIDRLFPPEREAFAEAALKHAKQLRVQALNEAFASGEVLKDPEEPKKLKSEPPVKQAPPEDPEQRSPLALRTGTSLKTIDLLRTSAFFGAVGDSPPITASHFYRNISPSQIPGDYLTEEEDDHVREAQAADARVKVFMKIADRRMKAIVRSAAPTADKKDQKKAEEEDREWGAVPKLSRAELLRHYAKAIAECMSKLEDAYERNPKSSALSKALAALRDSTDRQLQTLRSLEAEMKIETEANALREAINQAEIANKGARDGLK